MPHNRFYHPELTKEITLTGEEHFHLFKVMRAHEGSQIELIDGKGSLATGTVLTIDKKTAQIAVSDKQHTDPPKEKTLAQSLLKQPKLELVIEKCTELGVTDFHLFPAEKSERDHLSDNHLKRLHALILSATKQCGRLYLPTLHIYSKMPHLEEAAFATLRGAPYHLCSGGLVLEKEGRDSRFSCKADDDFGSEEPNEEDNAADGDESRGKNFPKSTFRSIKRTTNVKRLYIGPESGWSALEEEQMQAIPVTLHELTLRAETAAIVGCSLM